MNKQELVKLFAVVTVAVPGLLLGVFAASAQAISSEDFPASDIARWAFCPRPMFSSQSDSV